MDPHGGGSLPRGRHRLTREQVHASQHARLLRGMVEAVGEKGYAATSVADVLKRARVSRETFYEHFPDKHACFLAAYRDAAEAIVGGIEEVLVADAPLMARLERMLAAYLGELAADNPRARTYLLEIYAAGPAAAAARYAVQQRFVGIVGRLLGEDERFRSLPDPEFACRMLVGGVASLATGKVAIGEGASLPGLCAPILEHFRSLLERC